VLSTFYGDRVRELRAWKLSPMSTQESSYLEFDVFYFYSGSRAAFRLTCPPETAIFRSQALKLAIFAGSSCCPGRRPRRTGVTDEAAVDLDVELCRAWVSPGAAPAGWLTPGPRGARGLFSSFPVPVFERQPREAFPVQDVRELVGCVSPVQRPPANLQGSEAATVSYHLNLQVLA
jgi:hypothetical protein